MVPNTLEGKQVSDENKSVSYAVSMKSVVTGDDIERESIAIRDEAIDLLKHRPDCFGVVYEVPCGGREVAIYHRPEWLAKGGVARPA